MKGMLILLCVALSIPLTMYGLGLRINYTSSMPIGLYQLQTEQSIKQGDFVAVCLGKAQTHFALARGYIMKGHCPHGGEPLVKEVIAIPGDSVELTKAGFSINRQFYQAPVLERDHRERRLFHVSPFHDTKITNKYWLLGSNDITHSWDSRYFGGVHRLAIIGSYKPVTLRIASRIAEKLWCGIAFLKANGKAFFTYVKSAPTQIALNSNELQHTEICPPLPETCFATFFVTPLSQRQQVVCKDNGVMKR